MTNSACLLRKYGLREHDVDRALQEIMALPKDHPYRLSWEEAKSERSLQQNKYLFGCAYDIISKAQGYEKEDLHEDFLKRHFGVKLKRVPACKDYPEGLKEVPLRTTTTDEHGRRSVLGKLLFAEFVDFVQRYSAEHYGVVIPDADPDWKDHQEDA